MIVEDRVVKVLFTKSGGTAKGTAITNRVTLPTTWVRQLGITEDDRDVKIILTDDSIIIKKMSWRRNNNESD